MLYFKTIHSETLELLKEIQKIEMFKSLRLVGGTALALQIGHRVSVDLDFFGSLDADKISIKNEINKIGETTILQSTENINIFRVNDIKIDIVNYPYPWLEEKIVEDELRLAGIKDIAAMKLAAITGRGEKKDFIDLYFLLKHFSIKQMLAFYEQKYHDGSTFLLLRSLAYFDDADQDVSPKMFLEIGWDKIKSTISENLKDFMNNSQAEHD